MTKTIIRNEDFIINLYSVLDDLIQIVNKHLLPDSKNKGGRPAILTEGEMLTLICLRWKTATTSWKSFYYEIMPYYHSYFNTYPTYKNFITSVQRTLPLLVKIIPLLQYMAIAESDELFFVDSMPVEVCKVKRASSNKVCKGIASKKKSSMGWFYGLKLHGICNEKGVLVAIQITTGNVDDREPVKTLVKSLKGMIMADAGYIGEKLREELREMGIQLMAAPRNNMKKLMSKIQHKLLKKRQMIESVFSVIKTRLGLNCSLARSVNGLLTLIVSSIAWYQLKNLFNLVS